MSKEKSITESEAEKIIKENEKKIDSAKKKENKKQEHFWHSKKEEKEGFIGTNTSPNRTPGTRVVNTILMFLNVLIMVLLFLWIPSYLWLTLSEFKKEPGYSGNQVAGTDPFKPPYVAKAPAGVKSASAAEMGDMGFFDTRKHGFPYTMAQSVDDIGDGDFVMPNTIWANHIRDLFVQARNMFDNFLDIYKSIIGKIPPSLNPNVKEMNTTWGDVFKTFFGVFWVFIVTIIFILIGTGVAAQIFIGKMIGIPFIAAIYASVLSVADGFRMKECKDKAMGLLFSKMWWHDDTEEGWLATPMAKIWRLAYRLFLLFFIHPLNTVFATYVLPAYGFYWLFGRHMPETNKTVWYIVKKLISKYFIPLTIIVLLALAQAGNAEMYPAWFKVGPMFWKGGPKWRGNWKNFGGQSSDYWWGLGKKIGVGYPYVLGMLVILMVIINTFKMVIPWSTKAPPPVGNINTKEFILPKEEQWSYTGNTHLKYGIDGWAKRWKEQWKDGFKLKPPCGDAPTPKAQPVKGPTSAQGMVFDAVKGAAMNQPATKMAIGLQAAAKNPALNNKAALGAVALAAATGVGGTGAANVMKTVNKVNNAKNLMKQLGGRRKSRRRR